MIGARSSAVQGPGAAEATMPVLKHFDGVCHVYVDASADLEMAEDILINGKCQRPGVCNATESLLVHRDVAGKFVQQVGKSLRSKGVELRGCERTRDLIPEARPATEDDFRTEYLDLILAVKVVDSLADAIDHVETYGSHHERRGACRSWARTSGFQRKGA